MDSNTTIMNQEFVKLDRFNGTNFVHWKTKTLFLLTALKISYIMDYDLTPLLAPTPEDNDQVKEEKRNGKSFKEIYKSLEFMYNSEKKVWINMRYF